MFDYTNYYEWYKAAHVIAVICWMAAIMYLPRLFAYHSLEPTTSDSYRTFLTMEKRLLRVIMNPSMFAAYFFGLLNAYIYGLEALGVWFHVKFSAVILLTAYHGFLARCFKNFKLMQNKYSNKFYRYINEVPAVLMIIIVIMVIVKPFE